MMLIAVFAVFGLAACGGDDEGDGGTPAADLTTGLPTADDVGLDEQKSWEFADATDLVARGLVIGGATSASDLGAKIEDAGFQGAVGTDFGRRNLNVRVRAVGFDSEEGALEARDLLHDEDLKTPCADACIVAPVEYELSDVPDSVAVHHVPTGVKLEPGQSAVEAHHGEFVVGTTLYVTQMDGKPSPNFSDEFDELMGTIYESASVAGT